MSNSVNDWVLKQLEKQIRLSIQMDLNIQGNEKKCCIRLPVTHGTSISTEKNLPSLADSSQM